MLDPISDMLTRIRNAVRAGHPEVLIPMSKFKLKIAELLAQKKYIESFESDESTGHKKIKIKLRYINDDKGRPVSYIQNLQRVSKEGQRIYIGKNEIPRTKNGYGFSIVSTSKGLMSGEEAKKTGIGGELICEVW